jgi:hypothetical protein
MHALGISPRTIALVCVAIIIAGVVLAAAGVVTVFNALFNTLLLTGVAILNWRRARQRDKSSGL